jgi:RNA polymerase sigma factor (sigma-70 family)
MRIVKTGKLEIKENYDKVEWERAIPVLMAFAFSLLGNKKFTNRRDHLAYDFTMEAITKYLENPEKFDPSRNPDLINYLKYNILRQLITNFQNSAGVRKRIIIKKNIDEDAEQNYSYSLEQLYKQDQYIENNIDEEVFVERMIRKLDRKPELKEIFNLLYFKDSKRAEICEDLNISLRDYDNRYRRLKRLLDNEMKLLIKNKS